MKSIVAASLIAAACFPAVSIAQPTVKPTPPTPVTVTNDASNPVPVSIPAGTSFTGDVTVTNTPANPVPIVGIVDVNSSKVPFSQTFAISSTACACVNCCFPQTDVVPAGKRLEITHVSGYAPLSAVANLGPVKIASSSVSANVTIATVPAVFRTQWNGGDYAAYEFSQQLLAFVDAGNRASLSIFTGGAWNATRPGEVTITGYLVNAP